MRFFTSALILAFIPARTISFFLQYSSNLVTFDACYSAGCIYFSRKVSTLVHFAKISIPKLQLDFKGLSWKSPKKRFIIRQSLFAQLKFIVGVVAIKVPLYLWLPNEFKEWSKEEINIVGRGFCPKDARFNRYVGKWKEIPKRTHCILKRRRISWFVRIQINMFCLFKIPPTRNGYVSFPPEEETLKALANSIIGILTYFTLDR